MNYDYLNEIVKCPNCHNDVKDGDRIWLDGECLCPSCYKHKRMKYDEMTKKGYEKGYKDGSNR